MLILYDHFQVDYLRAILRTPMTVLKHHYWLNFTAKGMDAPTWINVMRYFLLNLSLNIILLF